MNSVIYFAAVVADAVAQALPDDELPYVAALLTSVGDLLALTALCPEKEE